METLQFARSLNQPKISNSDRLDNRVVTSPREQFPLRLVEISSIRDEISINSRDSIEFIEMKTLRLSDRCKMVADS